LSSAREAASSRTTIDKSNWFSGEQFGPSCSVDLTVWALVHYQLHYLTILQVHHVESMVQILWLLR
jgi:hypothetical protein